MTILLYVLGSIVVLIYGAGILICLIGGFMRTFCEKETGEDRVLPRMVRTQRPNGHYRKDAP